SIINKSAMNHEKPNEEAFKEISQETYQKILQTVVTIFRTKYINIDKKWYKRIITAAKTALPAILLERLKKTPNDEISRTNVINLLSTDDRKITRSVAEENNITWAIDKIDLLEDVNKESSRHDDYSNNDEHDVDMELG